MLNPKHLSSYRNIVFLICAFFIVSQTIAQKNEQNKIADSLKKELKKFEKVSASVTPSDTNRLVILVLLSRCYYKTGDYDPALEYALNAQSVAEEIIKSGNVVLLKAGKKGLRDAHNSIGIVFWYKGDYPVALKNYFAALKMSEELGSKTGIAAAYNNIGLLYTEQKDFVLAEKYSKEALKQYLALDIKKGIASAHNNLGNIYKNLKQYPLALEHQFEALKIREEIGDKYGIATSYNNLGLVYEEQKKFDESLNYYFKSLKIKEEVGDKQGYAGSLINIGVVYTGMKKSTEAKKYFTEGISLARSLGAREYLMESYKGLTKLDSLNKDWQAAYYHHNTYIAYRDSLINEENIQKTVQAQMEYEFDKKEGIAKAVQEKKDAIAEEEKHNQQLILWFVVGGLTIVAILLIFIYNRFRLTQKQKKIIEEQKRIVEKQKQVVDMNQKEILDSIHYASRIQRAMLTSEDYIKTYLKSEFFIFYQPKDIVSGDFYWAAHHNNSFYLATADCTGHGVPGAFMSLLNISYLNQNLTEENLTEPAQILNAQRKEIIKALNPMSSENNASMSSNREFVQDGMDCVLTKFDLEKKSLTFAAANNSLWLIRNKILTEYKGDKMPVGKFHGELKDFNQQTIPLEKGDIIYTLTDGFADQFGGTKGKKFKYKQLEELILNNCHLPMTEQQLVLSTAINDWKGEFEQVDDILVIGVKIT